MMTSAKPTILVFTFHLTNINKLLSKKHFGNICYENQFDFLLNTISEDEFQHIFSSDQKVHKKHVRCCAFVEMENSKVMSFQLLVSSRACSSAPPHMSMSEHSGLLTPFLHPQKPHFLSLLLTSPIHKPFNYP